MNETSLKYFMFVMEQNFEIVVGSCEQLKGQLTLKEILVSQNLPKSKQIFVGFLP